VRRGVEEGENGAALGLGGRGGWRVGGEAGGAARAIDSDVGGDGSVGEGGPAFGLTSLLSLSWQ
jgi:hypothetical protein